MIVCPYLDKNSGKCLNSNDSRYNCVHCAGSVDDRENEIITKDFSEEVYFAPWIGKEYEKANFFGRKVLVLGNSHYCRNEDLKICGEAYKKCAECGHCIKQRYSECCYSTIDVVGYYITNIESKTPWTALKVVSALDDDSLMRDDCYKSVRDSIAFYNYVQESLADGSSVPSRNQCRQSEAAFFEILEVLRPELVISLGTSHMFATDMPNDTYENGNPVSIDGNRIKHGYYFLKDGTRIHTVWIRHPSARCAYDYLYWNRAIQLAIEKE